MNLYLQPGSIPWQPERYHYAVEQMLFTLFPGEKPEYPTELPDTLVAGDQGVHISLNSQDNSIAFTAQVAWNGRLSQAVETIPASSLEQSQEQVYHTIQHTLKMAFYRAAVPILGAKPPWGALTGVRPVKLPTRAMKAGATFQEAQTELEQVFDVTPLRAKLAVDCAKASLEVGNSLRPKEVSLYLGIPFCPTRCAYCSFVSADIGRSLKQIPPYLDAVYQEIDATAQVLRASELTIRSFYMGGGTPTTLTAEQMDRLLTKCRDTLPLDSCTEYTVEAGRPDTITREKLEVLARHGIERISINPQTLQDEVLRAIGRCHSAEDIFSAYRLARDIGFSCINMDLIAGLPCDTYDGFCRTLDGVLALEPNHITIHTLALKKGAYLKAHAEALPSGTEVTRMLDFSLGILRDSGFLPYYLYRQKMMSGSLENVGWTRPGQESLYNIVMMEELQTVVSIGGGGITKLIDPVSGKILRLPNPKYPHDYLSGLDKVLGQKQSISTFYASSLV